MKYQLQNIFTVVRRRQLTTDHRCSLLANKIAFSLLRFFARNTTVNKRFCLENFLLCLQWWRTDGSCFADFFALFDRILMGEVKILSEACLSEPMYPVRLTSLDKLRPFADLQEPLVQSSCSQEVFREQRPSTSSAATSGSSTSCT